MRPVQAALYAGMTHIRTNIINRFETATGMQIRYSSIRPTIFGSFDIRNLRLIRNETTIFSVSLARVSFSLKELLLGRNTPIKSIHMDRLAIRLDTEKDKNTLEFLSSLINERDSEIDFTGFLSEFIPDKVDLHLRDCVFILTDMGITYQIQNINIDIFAGYSSIYINGKMTAEVKDAELFNNTYNVKSEVIVNGVYSINAQAGNAEVLLTSITGTEQEGRRRVVSIFYPVVNLPAAAFSSENKTKALFEASPMNFGISYENAILNVRTLGEDNLNSAFFDYNFSTGDMHAAVNCHDFILLDLIRFADNRKNINNMLSQSVTGNASFQRYRDAVMLYNVDFSGGSVLGAGDYFIVSAHGSEKEMIVNEVVFSSFAGKTSLFNGKLNLGGRMGFSPFMPAGTVVFDRFSLYGNDSLSASLVITSQRNEIFVSGENIMIGQSKLESFYINLIPTQKDVGIVVSALCEEQGLINMEATYYFNPGQLDTFVSIDSFSLLNIGYMLSPFMEKPYFSAAYRNILQDARIYADIFITTDFTHIVYNAPSILIKTGDFSGLLSFSGTDRQFSLSEGIITRNDKDFVFSAHVGFSNPMDIGFRFNANYQDLSWNVEGQVLDRSTLIVRDPNGLAAYGHMSSSGAVSGYMEAVNYPVPASGQPVYLNFYTTLRYTSRNLWFVNIDNFEARDINFSYGSFRNTDAFFRFSGIVNQDGASFRDFTYSDKIGSLTGDAGISWEPGFSHLQFNLNITDGNESGENYFAQGIFRNEQFNITANVFNMRLDRFINEDEAVLLNGDFFLEWDSFDSFDAKINLTSLNTTRWGSDLQTSAVVLINHDEFNVRDLNLDYSNVNLTLPELTINLREGFVKANAVVDGFIYEKILKGNIEVDASLKSISSWIEIRQALNSIEGSLKTGTIHYGNIEQAPSVFVFSHNNGGLSVSGGPGNMLRLEMDSDGNFFTSLSAPFPIRTSIVGSFRDGMIDAHCNDFFMDLSAFWALLPQPVQEFNIAGGYVTAKLDIRGTLANPQFYGSGRGSSLRLQAPSYISQDMRPVPFNITLEGQDMTFGPVITVIGNGRANVEGWFRFDGWVPRSLGMDITIPRETPVPYNLNVAGFLANGEASGRMFLGMDSLAMEVSGDLFANNSELGLNMDDISQSQPQAEGENYFPRIYAIINMRITTGPVVEFFWPNTTFPLLRANPEMGTVLVVSADTAARQYTLNSDIVIRSGELYYFDRSFYIRQGNLVLRENEQQFSPRISARAEIRDRTDLRPVTISMIIENEPLLSFVPRFEANPALTQLEIYSLLGQNLYGINVNESLDTAQRFIVTSTTDIVAQLAANTDFFSQFVAIRQFERQFRNLFNLDMFSIRTRFIQNAVVQNVFFPTTAEGVGQPPVDRNRVGNYFDNTTVFMGKYVGQDMFIQGMISMRYDENNASMGGLKFEPDIGIELQSPLFNIRWDFFPYHPENWWVNDNSITLTWSRSF
jgi:hypothetical protein